MRKTLIILCLGCAPGFSALAGDDALSYNLELSLAYSELNDQTFGEDPNEDQLVEEEYELAFLFEYHANNQLYYYFGGSLIDETEEIKPNGERKNVAGFERGEMGVGYSFGDEIESEIRVGRREYISSSDWWNWWDEDLDSVSLESRFGKFEALVAIAEEQVREVSGLDRIDPELEDVRRILASFDWEFTDGQLLQFYYLDKDDDSSSYQDGQSVDQGKIDEEDADLTWSGINYLGWFEVENLGEFEIELAWAHVSGRETVYEIDDPAGGRADVDETTVQRITGDAYGAHVNWRPAAFDGITLVLGHAMGSGDPVEDDGKDESFRQTDLQGDSDVFGGLYQPELSNLIVDTIGIDFELFGNIDIGLFRHDYRQHEVADEMRDVIIEIDTGGSSRTLGREIDLVLTFDLYDFEVELIAAEFEAGSAYGRFRDETSQYWKIELTYVF